MYDRWHKFEKQETDILFTKCTKNRRLCTVLRRNSCHFHVFQVLMQKQDRGSLTQEEVDSCSQYIEKTVHLCWAMIIQDPPVCLYWDITPKETFNTTYFSHYTRSGKAYDYVVWPSMMLHENGPVLRKGVAQAQWRGIWRHKQTLRMREYCYWWSIRCGTDTVRCNLK
jgi:hypothetical protein